MFKTRNQELYSDIPINLDTNPVSGDLTRLVNESCVAQSIKNLLMIDKGEFLFNPTLGSNVRRLLFDSATPDTLMLIKDMVKTTIVENEPRCNVVDVSVSGDLDSNSIKISIVYNVINKQSTETVSVFLDRVR